jgi:hypothetical protein
VRDTALRALGTSTATATRVPSLGEDAYSIDTGDRWNLVVADLARDVVIVLECGKSACPTSAKLVEIGRSIVDGIGAAAGDRRKMRVLFTSGDVPGWDEVPVAIPELHEYDRVFLESTVRGKDHSLEVEAWLRPDDGLAAKLAAVARAEQMQPDEAVAPGGMSATTDDAFAMAFAIGDSSTVVRVVCHRGLCPTKELALGLAHRAAAKAVDATNFINPEAERPRPFVPRGNVKGRAERIWLPLARFWLPIR